uniref:Uncharacterized protein n=1 Tax=Tanacetum cinerariifolium TaxID=118510 RepID=A0A6L2KDH9_TANCI|nr:hypothetical protein [Tanacetum cinerariifolium]
MDTTIDQQVAMDEALIPTAQRLRIGRSNFRLLSDISKESTLQLVYDVLRICPFFKAFLVTADEDFVYQVEHKNQKKSNEMYYPRFTKAIIHHFMSKDPSIPKRNKVNWHYVRDDHMFSTIKMVSRHQNTQQFGVLLPIELTNAKIRNSKAYKEYYAIATGEAAPKPKASVRKTRSSFDTSITPPTAAASPKLIASARENKQPNCPKPKVYLPSLRKDNDGDEEDEGDDGEEGNGDDDDDDEDDDGDKGEEGDDDDADQEVVRDDESFDPIPQTPENSEDDGNGKEDLGLNIGEEERHIEEEEEEEEEDELYRDVNINKGRGLQASLEVEDSHVTLTPVNPDGQQQSSLVSSQFMTSLLNPTLDVGMESIFETTSKLDVPTPTSVAPRPITAPTMTPSTIATTTTNQAPILPTTVSSTIIQNLPNFGSLFRFDDRLRALEANFSEFKQTNQFAGAVSSIPRIVNRYMDQQMNEAVKVAIQIQSDRLHDETQRENDEFLRTVDENMKKIIKEQVKEQVKVQVSKILPRIKQVVNEQLAAEVLTRSSHSSRTSYVVAADLSEMELKKILIEKIEGNNDDDADKDEEPFAGPDRGSKRCREGKEPESASALTETVTRSAGYTRISELAKKVDSRSSFNELMDTPLDFSNFLMNRLRVDTLTLELLVGPTYELMKGSYKSLIELEYHLEEVYKATTDQLDWVNPEGQQYPHNLPQPLPLMPDNRGRYDKHALWGVSHWRRKRQQFHSFTVNQESARDVYSKRRIIAVTELKIVEWHSYKHLDWIMVRRDDDKLYKFKEGDFKRLRIQDIKDILLLLVQRKLTNLTVEECFAFNVSLRMFTRSIVIQRRVEDLQLGVESYQKKLNLTKPHTYRSDLKRKEAYTAYSNPRGFIYQNKDKKNRLMRIDELHKFSDGTLTDVRTALDDRLKGIRMQYLPQTIWRKSDKDRAAAMIQAIDKRLETKRIMRSLERFVGGRLYEGDFRMLRRTT